MMEGNAHCENIETWLISWWLHLSSLCSRSSPIIWYLIFTHMQVRRRKMKTQQSTAFGVEGNWFLFNINVLILLPYIFLLLLIIFLPISILHSLKIFFFFSFSNFSAAQWVGSAHCQTDRGPCQLWSVDWNTGTVFFSLYLSLFYLTLCLEAWYCIRNNAAFTEKHYFSSFFSLCFKEHHVLYLLTENTLVSQVLCYLFSPVFMIHSVEFQFVIFASLSSALLLVKHTVISTGTFSLSSVFFLFCICQNGFLFQRFFKIISVFSHPSN